QRFRQPEPRFRAAVHPWWSASRPRPSASTARPRRGRRYLDTRQLPPAAAAGSLRPPSRPPLGADTPLQQRPAERAAGTEARATRYRGATGTGLRRGSLTLRVTGDRSFAKVFFQPIASPSETGLRAGGPAGLEP